MSIPIAALGTALLVGCSVVAPPPLSPAHATLAPAEPGTVTVSLVTGLAGGAFVDPGLGAELRVVVQDDDDTAYGVALGGGARLGDRPKSEKELTAGPAEPLTGATVWRGPERRPVGWLLAARGFVVQTLTDGHHLGATFGAGLGVADGGLVYTTAAAGARTATHDGDVDGYLALGAALSIPILRGRAISLQRRGDELVPVRPSTTFYLGGDLGMVFAEGRDWSGSLGTGLLVGFAAGNESVILQHAAVGAAHRRRDQ